MSATEGLLHASDELNGASSALAKRPATGGLADGEFEVIDEVTREHLTQFAVAIPRSKGKRTKVLEEYAIVFPATKLSAETLRCRLNETRKARKTDPLLNTPSYSNSQINTLPEASLDAREASETKKRPACQSCRDAKRKCGVDSRNLNCQYKQQPQRTMSSFFNISTDSSSKT
ncbi:hypothetical protein PR002_g9970 [Phytophthora rubi]|uniref:Uncharacterized protein n=1 Tax=Phytophthora rubi TaxID=129364 RepID=A0A6A3MGW2_9STRA|nr:hypothetical protein PR002_g9970 [Phytophthora rubi]